MTARERSRAGDAVCKSPGQAITHENEKSWSSDHGTDHADHGSITAPITTDHAPDKRPGQAITAPITPIHKAITPEGVPLGTPGRALRNGIAAKGVG